MVDFLSKVQDQARKRKVSFTSRKPTDKDNKKTAEAVSLLKNASEHIKNSTGLKLPTINEKEVISSVNTFKHILPENKFVDLDLGIGIDEQSLNIAPKNHFVDNLKITRYKAGPAQLSAEKTLYNDSNSNIKVGGRVDTKGDYSGGLQASLKFNKGGAVKKKTTKKPRGWGCAKMSTRGK
jgi:hypothetical protein|tara:strand:+ start:486 stop:1025 length:540 start_codon:yes stop_codon:yes gene_type:complete